VTRRDAIATTLYRYCWGIDAGDADLAASCFAEDGELETPDGTLVGRGAIHADIARRRETRAARGVVRHFVTNLLVEETADGKATARSVWSATAHKDGVTSVFATGWYEDRLGDVGGSWLIERRTIHIDGR
jgi:hypothetical protein